MDFIIDTHKLDSGAQRPGVILIQASPDHLFLLLFQKDATMQLIYKAQRQTCQTC